MGICSEDFSDFECKSFNICELCSKLAGNVSKKSIEAVLNLKSSNPVNPVADVIQNVYYSQVSTPKQKPEKKPLENREQMVENVEAVENEAPAVAGDIKPLRTPKKKNFDEKFCPPNVADDDDEPSESASELMEKRRLERLAKEKEKKDKLKKEENEAYKNFLEKQEAENLQKQTLSEPPKEDETSENDEGKQECFYENECAKEVSELEVGVIRKVLKVEYSKTYLKMKFAIQMQNYKIYKSCQELKILKQRAAAPSQIIRLKEQLRKEIEKLRGMIEHAMNAQKLEMDENWGSIPVSTVSMAQLESTSFEFEKVEMPKAPSNMSLSENLFAEVEEKLLKKEKSSLEKQVELRQERERFMCLSEKSKQMEDELFVLKELNAELKQKEQYFDSVREDFNPDEKVKEIQTTMDKLMGHLTKMKDEFDDIHIKLHEMKH